MRSAAAYVDTQSVTLSQETAFAELYLRLARWTLEMNAQAPNVDWAAIDARLESSLSLLAYMDRSIDLSGSYEVAAAILSLHRFAIGAMVRAKAKREISEIAGLAQIFVSVAEIFEAIRVSRAGKPS